MRELETLSETEKWELVAEARLTWSDEIALLLAEDLGLPPQLAPTAH